MTSDESKLIECFNQIKPDLEKWGDKVDQLLMNEVLNDIKESIKIPPRARLKSNGSIIFKTFYRKKEYEDPLLEIEDKVGTRIVVLKSTDIDEVQNRIINSNNWKAKITKSINQEIEDKPNIFDYQSLHIVVWPKDSSDYSCSDTKILSCEIQIRTLLQHAFAEISHDNVYKGPYQNDKDIIRRLAKAMALMEATDDYFCDIFQLLADEERYFSNYMSDLTEIFQELHDDESLKTKNIESTDLILQLLSEEKIEVPEIKRFVTQNAEKLKRYTKASNSKFFQEPVILLVFYYLENHQTFLRKNWPLNEKLLKSIYSVAGTSYNNY